MAFPHMEAVIGSMILKYIFETYLEVRQHMALKLPTLPKTLEGVISREQFERSRAYSLDKSHFNFVRAFVQIVRDSTILFFRALPWLWKKSGDFVTSVGLNAENEILHTLAFLPGLMIWLMILDLPFSLYSTFVIEARHGLNEQTPWLFVRDMIKEICLAVIIGPPIVAAIIVIVQAYVHRFFKNTRIVLHDTLIQPCNKDEEILAVLAHELGHWKLNHSLYKFCYYGGYTLVRNSSDLFQSFGFDTQPVLIGHILFVHIVFPLEQLVKFGRKLVRRSFEFQVDAFAKKLGYASALRSFKLQKGNLAVMIIDPWYSAYHYSHPPTVERLASLDKSDKKED